MKIIALNSLYSRYSPSPYPLFPLLCRTTLLAVLSPGYVEGAVEECSAPFIPASGSYQFVQEESVDGDSRTEIEAREFGEIYFTRLPIFDEANANENNALFRWANRFHILSRERTVAQQLLFASDQEFSARIVAESARILRDQGYFYDAAIRPVRLCDERVDVEVITKDNWSFTPSITIDRSGGENTFSYGLREANFLGRGKEFGVANSRDIDRRSSELFYEDRNVLGSRVRNKTAIINSSDGHTQVFELAQPFFALDSRQSWAVHLQDEERQDEQFFRSDDVSEVEHDLQDFSIEYGVSRGLKDGSARRWIGGYRYRKDEFSIGDELPPPLEFPSDKELSYPFLRFEAVEDRYETAFNLDQIYRTEDLHLGYEFSSQIGFAADAFGSDQDRLVLDSYFSDTLAYNADMYWQHSLEWEGLWNLETDEAEDLVVSYETRYFRRQTERRSFFASVEAVYSKNLSSHRQIILGGFTGARAFDNRFQVGDRMLQLTMEERLYTDIHLWNLIRLGGAVFVDVGRAWEPGSDNGMEDKILADVGFGLRLASSKAASGRIAHIDFAFPLTNRDDPDVRSLQIAFSIKGTF